MRLSWSNQTDIAAALMKAYPDMDRLSLTPDYLLRLIQALPEFSDSSPPPHAKSLDHIRWTWMRLADEGFDDERRCS